MADNSSRSNDVLHHLSRLSDQHEIVLMKRQAIIQMQKYQGVGNKSRSTEKKKLMTEASKRNKQLFDDISVTERNLRTAKYSSSENRLDLLRDHYFEYVKSKYPEFLKNIETEKEMSCSFSD